ncbi:MAG: sensor histidine kinase [Trebonia sp.]
MTTEVSPVRPLPGRAGFLAAAAAFTADIVLGVVISQVLRPARPLPVALVAGAAAIAAAVMMLRQHRPLLVYAAVVFAGVILIGGDFSNNPVWFATLLVTGWCALTSGRRAGLACWIATLVLFTVQLAAIRPDPGWGPWLVGSTLLLLGGLLLRSQLGLVAQLRAAQAGLAARARAEERNRISRDLHDVIAHTLTVSLLHVMSARLAVEHDPADAARALAEAERLGRESLTEVRQVVGMLRDDADRTATAPPPGAGSLPTLVERFQAAGANVTMSVDGDPGRLPATVGLAVYRILQEALTNVIKHAPGVPVAARLAVAPGSATLTVDSLGPPGTGNGAGHGLLSMRERAESVGGSCEAGPSGAGWLVRASFPLEAA